MGILGLFYVFCLEIKYWCSWNTKGRKLFGNSRVEAAAVDRSSPNPASATVVLLLSSDLMQL